MLAVCGLQEEKKGSGHARLLLPEFTEKVNTCGHSWALQEIVKHAFANMSLDITKYYYNNNATYLYI